jgi:PAS domain-containing protein
VRSHRRRPLGTHFCQFFETKEDLLDTLLPYFAAGLDETDLCHWLVAEPLTTDETESVLRRLVPDLARHLTDGSIEIRPARKRYLKGDALDLGRVIRAWDEKLDEALARGFAGLRISASTAWLSNRDWSTFTEYEAQVNESIAGKSRVVLCTYPLATSGAAEILDVARTHQFALAKRDGGWEILEKRTHNTLDQTYRVVRADGSIRWIRDRGFPIRDGSGEAYRFAGVAEDITERRRVEDERGRLFESETRARAEAEAALERLRAIDTITDSALVHLGLDELLRELLVRLRRVLDADSAVVLLLDEEGKALYPPPWTATPTRTSLRSGYALAPGVTERIAAEGRPLIVDDCSTVDLSGIEGVAPSDVLAMTRSVMRAPLRVGNKVVE